MFSGNLWKNKNPRLFRGEYYKIRGFYENIGSNFKGKEIIGAALS